MPWGDGAGSAYKIEGPGSARRALREHEEILRCVEAGDAAGARQQMRLHLMNTAKDIEAALGEGTPDGETREMDSA